MYTSHHERPFEEGGVRMEQTLKATWGDKNRGTEPEQGLGCARPQEGQMGVFNLPMI